MIYFFITLLWLAIAITDYSELCYVWQLKEYRLDRFGDYLGTKQGKSFLKSFLVLGRFSLLVLMVFFFFANSQIASGLFVIAIIFETVRYATKLFGRKLKKPVLTKRAILILTSAIVFEMIVWIFWRNLASMAIVFSLRSIVLSLIVGVSFLPSKIVKKMYVAKAARKIGNYRDLKIIGVTGSYGKTTVKKFLAQILTAKYRVITTPKNINTEIGIAKFILRTDFSEKDVFIVEMGAYRIGEIKTICDMVKPEIGILTAISEQHLSLFGSIENIQQAKYELLRFLPENGLAITNSDNKYCREFLAQLKTEVKTFGQNFEFKPNCLLENIKTNDKGEIVFDCDLDGGKIAFESWVIGQHNAMNIAPCVMVSKQLGMENNVIIEQVKKLVLPEGTLQKFQYGRSVILDDSYNANPDGFVAALKVLDDFDASWRKIVITRGMLELGDRSEKLHESVGKEISKHADELVIISNDSEAQLRKGVGDETRVLSIFEKTELLEYLKKLKDIRAVVLLENRMPVGMIEELKK